MSEVKRVLEYIKSNISSVNTKEIYCKAIESEFRKRNIEFIKNVSIDIIFNDEVIGSRVVDYVIGTIALIVYVSKTNKKSYSSELSEIVDGVKYTDSYIVNFGTGTIIDYTTRDPLTCFIKDRCVIREDKQIPQKVFIMHMNSYCCENNLKKIKFNELYIPFTIESKEIVYDGKKLLSQPIICGVDVIRESLEFTEDY